MHWGLIFVSALGIWLFVRGFLLSRRSCDRHSPINSDITSSGKSNDSGRIYNHTLILLVDALRFDFAIPLPSKVFDID
jgi:predicted AlkP superfamily pyrophosphatase or phosphodiesterase